MRTFRVSETNQDEGEIIMDVNTSLLDSSEVIEEIMVSDETPPCECDHGTEEEYVPCSSPAAFRMIFDCTCEDEDHGKSVVLFCAQCKSTFLAHHGTEGVTVIPL